MPANKPLDSISNAFKQTWELYNVNEAIILFIVLDNEINVADQRHLEYSIYDKLPNVDIQRTTLANLYHNSIIDENKALY